MFRKAAVTLVSSVLILLMVAPGAMAAGAGPEEAMVPGGAWRELLDGASHWYAFSYDGEGNQIVVRMNLAPVDGAIFRVVTPECLRNWQVEGKLIDCGVGSPNQFDPADRIWAGSFNQPGTYFILVEHTGFRPGPVYYSLSISGKGIGFLAAPVEAEPEAMEAAAPEAGAGAVPEVVAGGTGPDDTLAPAADWMPIDAGQWIWFAVQYGGTGSSIQVSMDANLDTVEFAIWTDETIRRWAAGEKEQPVGRGAENDFAPGDLSWAGSFPGPTSFYIVVQNDGGNTADFNLTASGQDVWF